MAGQRITDARDRLPGKAGVGIVDQIVGELAARNAGTTADEALQAIISTKVKQAVQHEGESRRRTAETALVEVDLGALVSRFGFQTETAEIIADIGVAIPAFVVVHIGHGRGGGARSEVDVLIFNEHDAGVDTDVPAIVARQGRGGQGASRKSSREGKLPHLDSPFKSVTKDC